MRHPYAFLWLQFFSYSSFTPNSQENDRAAPSEYRWIWFTSLRGPTEFISSRSVGFKSVAALKACTSRPPARH